MRCVTNEELAVVSGSADPNGCKSDIFAGAGIGAVVGTGIGVGIGALVGIVAGPGGVGMGAAYGAGIGGEIGALTGGAAAAAYSPACQPTVPDFPTPILEPVGGALEVAQSNNSFGIAEEIECDWGCFSWGDPLPW